MSRGGRPAVLITGGAGFIGVNCADHYLKKGWRVSIFDNFSRKGTRGNARWLKTRGRVRVVKGDVRSRSAVERWVRGTPNARLALHMAAQVAVTTSVVDPRTDFECNALGSVNFLEALRRLKRKPLAIYASTNKVYGGMEHVGIRLARGRYAYSGLPNGVAESEPLDFHSPYGCSKGSADQYFRDYHRIYGLPTVVFRQSCIYGPHQNGTEDQGWVAHFMMAAQAGKGITLFGDGRQVRDVLYIEDLMEAYDRAYARRAKCAGGIYNMGGGPRRTLSLLELLDWIGRRRGGRVPVKRRGWRPGDQRVYVSGIRKARRELGWTPRTSVNAGLGLLWDWLKEGRR